RGYSPEAIRAFAELVGVSKANSWVDFGKLEYCLRSDLNQQAPRVLGVLRPIEVELVGLPAGVPLDDAPYFPADVGKPGARPLAISDRIYIDRDDWRDEPPGDYQRLAPGRTVRLRYGYCITASDVVARDAAGEVTRLRATVHPETGGGKNFADGRKVSVIHWVDAATAIDAEVRLYGHLFKANNPEEGGQDFLTQLDPGSLEVIEGAKLEASLAGAEVLSRWQLERVGFFAVDQDSKPGALVLNRIVTLRDAREKKPEVAAEAPVEKQANAKAKTRPKSKSPQEYRAEARVRDPELAAAHDKAAALVSAEAADLLTGDVTTARLFLAVTERSKPETAAKWMVNELPRALAEPGARPLDQLAAGELGALLAAIDAGEVTTSAGKTLLTALIKTGEPFAALKAAAAAAPAVDLGPAVDAVLAANADKASQYKAGKTGLLGFLVGQVMKAAPGADAAAVNQLLRDRLA
ncbi:MAG TPA: hypothetical protein VGC42_16490, partial [Kofleriaceae bacterium]